MREGAADGGVGVQDGVAGGVVGRPDGQRGDQLAAAGLGDDPAAQPGPDEMEFGFGELPFHPQEEPVVKVPRVIQAVFVADQGPVMPRSRGAGASGGVAGQPGAFQAGHDPGPAQGDLGDQVLESFPVGGGGAGVALAGVDDGDLVRRPAQADRLAAQVVLADRGLGVVDDLLEAGLGGGKGARPRHAGDPVLAPVLAIRDELEVPAMQRMEWVRHPDTSVPIGRIRCS